MRDYNLFEENPLAEYTWRNFEKSGSVNDYLVFKEVEDLHLHLDEIERER